MSETSLGALAAGPRETGDAGARPFRSALFARRLRKELPYLLAASASRRENSAGLAGLFVGTSRLSLRAQGSHLRGGL